ncbi:MAG TPA: hypothetical protein VJ750_06900 [Rhizomicrobium sp.]|nr:hypothetical protein [Rhizomicrobium sp.]
MGERNKSLIRRVIEGLAIFAIVRGIFFALAERAIYPDLWVARLIDSAATLASTSTQAVTWLASGAVGLLGILLLEKFLWPWWNRKHIPAGSVERTGATKRAMFETATGGKISAQGAQIHPGIPFTIGRAETGGHIMMDGVKFVFE